MFTEKNKFIIKQAYEKYHNEEHADFYDGEFSDKYYEKKAQVIDGKKHRDFKIIIRRSASIAAVVCAVVAVGVAASVGRASKDDTFKTKLDNIYENSSPITQTPEGTPQKLTITVGGEKIELNYVRSDTDMYGQIANEYEDSKGTRYELDQNGNIIRYSASYADRSNSDGGEILTEKQIHNIVMKMYTQMYPEFAKDSVLTDCNCAEVTESFVVGFGKMYGKDKFIIGESFRAVIKNNGFINAWAMNKVDIMEDLDTEVLNKIDKKTIREYAEKTMKAKYSDTDVKCELSFVSLVKIDNSYALEIFANYNGRAETIYYDLN